MGRQTEYPADDRSKPPCKKKTTGRGPKVNDSVRSKRVRGARRLMNQVKISTTRKERTTTRNNIKQKALKKKQKQGVDGTSGHQGERPGVVDLRAREVEKKNISKEVSPSPGGFLKLKSAGSKLSACSAARTSSTAGEKGRQRSSAKFAAPHRL